MTPLSLMVFGLTWLAVILGVTACVVVPPRMRIGMCLFLFAVTWLWLIENLQVFDITPDWMADPLTRSFITRGLVAGGFAAFVYQWVRSLPKGGGK